MIMIRKEMFFIYQPYCKYVHMHHLAFVWCLSLSNISFYFLYNVCTCTCSHSRHHYQKTQLPKIIENRYTSKSFSTSNNQSYDDYASNNNKADGNHQSSYAAAQNNQSKFHLLVALCLIHLFLVVIYAYETALVIWFIDFDSDCT